MRLGSEAAVRESITLRSASARRVIRYGCLPVLRYGQDHLHGAPSVYPESTDLLLALGSTMMVSPIASDHAPR